MGRNDDHIQGEDEDLSRTLTVGQPLYELGSHIGGYQLLSVLGEGGFGVVYLAQQEHPLQRLAALKVVKPGMDTKQVIARFESERQALAMLDHPNIARVFDAGTTEAGRPYFAMEYVKGIPITEYCDRYKLGTQERLRLFIPLCQAIQHAHHKGIIHRDIKPSNVLVMLHDEKPIPKIIDFGVAKALNQRLTEKTLFTEQGQVIGTPEYMSPEQAELTGLDVDTRTDIYSLGVLLYELLTGCTPFDPHELRSKGYAEMQRIIREQDPVKPSTKLTALGGQVEDVARHRNATAEQLQKSVRGDLDWIVMKTLEKDRTRRYETADGLAMDLEHHINHEPVRARPPSRLYRFQKLVRRNRGVFAAVAVVAAVLVVGVFVSTWLAVRATQAEHEQSLLREHAVAAQEKETGLRQQAEARELALRQLAYASDISLAQQALAMNDLGRAWQLLDDHRPRPGEVDLRGWEWRYLWQECQSDALSELCRSRSPAYSVAYSPDGRMLAVAGSEQGFVEIWDVPGHKRIARLQPNEGSLVAFSPHGDLLATDAEKQIRLWRTGTWDLARRLPLPEGDNPLVLKFSPDGRWLACANSSNKVHQVLVWEVDQGTLVHRLRGVTFLSFWSALDFSPDSKTLAIGDANQCLQVVDLAGGSTTYSIPKAHPEGISAVAWSPDGSLLASGSGFSGGPIQLWDAASGQPLGKLEGHTSWICELIFSADSRWLYSASGDQTIRIWEIRSGQCLATLRGSSHEVYGLALAPDGTTLASACKDGVVAFWSALPRPEKEQPRRIALGRYGWPAFAPDGRVLAVPRAGTVCLFDLATVEEIERLPTLGDDVLMVTYSPDGTLLASHGTRGKVRVWSCTEHRLLRELEGHNAMAYLLRFQADGRRLLSVDIKGEAIWWDTLTWQRGPTFVVEFTAGWAVSPDGRLLARGDAGALHWFSAETGDLLKTTAGPPYSASRVAFSSDGTRVAGASEYGTVTLWDPASFQLIAAFKGHMQGAHGVAFSPDGRRLATGGGTDRDTVKLWDLSTHRELLTLPGQGSLFIIVVFSPDGQWLATCSLKGELHLWHAPSWARIEAAEKGRPSQP